MKIALIADIHGNLAACDTVLHALAAEHPDRIVCLGDVAASGPQPREVLARLREAGCPVVMGNADAPLLDPENDDPGDDERMIKIVDISRWAAAQLDAADLAFIRSFAPTVEIDLGPAGRLLCGHGSPRSYDDLIFATTPDEEIAPMMAGHTATIYAGGHTHRRLLRSWRGGEIVNPGSVGLAYQFRADGTARVPPWAEFALLTSDDSGAISVDFRRLAYDRAATLRAMRERAMPHTAWWAENWV